MGFIQRFIRDEEGVTAIEYGLLAALIAIAIIGAVTTLGTEVGDLFDRISVQVAAALAG